MAFVCPKCSRTSHHPADERHRYCGACKLFVDDWQPIDTAPDDGTVCELMFRDIAGPYQGTGLYFLHDDGVWYRIHPPSKLERKPFLWRPAQRRSRHGPPEKDHP